MKKSELIESLQQCFHEYIDDYSLEYVIEKMVDRAVNTHKMAPPEMEGKYVDGRVQKRGWETEE